jgi:regulator of sigma E protease
MMQVLDLLYIFFALLGLGFLIFIHELGHYFMAKKMKMKVEVFSIGFGKPLLSWKRKKVRWQLCWFPVGGYVKIAGMTKDTRKDPYKIPHGFFSKKPYQRILVALMGPLMNVIFALLVFTVLWLWGGREQSFSEHTRTIGFVDPKSKLHQLSVRAGDEISKYGQKPYHGVRDLFFVSALKHAKERIEGYKVDYYTKAKKPFHYFLPTYPYGSRGFSTLGVLAPASYLIYMPPKEEKASILFPNERILWVNGIWVFSREQFFKELNAPWVFLQVKRGNEILGARVPLVQLKKLQLSSFDREEMGDWKHEAGMKKPIEEMVFFPFYVNENCRIETPFAFTDKELEEKIRKDHLRNPFFVSFQRGDQILSINGKKVEDAVDILSILQKKSLLMVLQKGDFSSMPFQKANQEFVRGFWGEDVKKMVETGNRERKDLRMVSTFLQQKKEAASLGAFYEHVQDKQYILGIEHLLLDRPVTYNPNPLQLSQSLLGNMGRFFVALITGSIQAKWMMGPVGIIHLVQKSWVLGFKEAFFLLGVISLNLALFNLLPIPLLDGGNILFSLYEMVTRRRVKLQTMEKFILPFILLLLALFLFVTYHDLVRIFSRFFS